jgi:hypothetical protein
MQQLSDRMYGFLDTLWGPLQAFWGAKLGVILESVIMVILIVAVLFYTSRFFFNRWHTH